VAPMPTIRKSKPRIFIVIYDGNHEAQLVTSDAKKARLYCKKENASWPSLKFRVVSIDEFGEFCYNIGYDDGFDEGSAGDDW